MSTARAALLAFTLLTASCSVVDVGLEQVAGAAEIALQQPGSLDGIPLLPNGSAIDPNLQNQPPGISVVFGTYGRNDIPLLTLHAYAGAPAALSAVISTYETTVGGDKTGESRCVQQSGQTATCWRSQSNLLVGVSTIDGRALADLAKVVDEAWTSVRS